MAVRGGVAIRLGLAIAAGCSGIGGGSPEIETGHTHVEVRRILGEPDDVQEFPMPDGPFFGPQELLIDIVPAGSVVEEWQFRIEGEVRYVWFAGEETQPREEWRVVGTAVYPEGVVF